MPSLVHEIFTARLADGISSAISALAERLGGKAGDALRGISSGGSPTLKLKGPAVLSSSSQDGAEGGLVHTWRSSERTFFHEEGLEWPGLVLEVSFRQKGRELERIAEGYVVDSLGGIRCVVGVQLPCIRDLRKRTCIMGIDMTASVSVWRPMVEEDENGEETVSCVCEVDSVPFMSKNGARVEGQLELGVKDLLSSDVLSALDAGVQDEKISIPFSDLWTFYRDAQRAKKTPGLPS
jgi:hypothetical protein